MSIVIPASQLKHTVITVRCESSRSAPQIECSFDDQAPPGLSSHSDKGASFSFAPRRQTSAPLVSPIQVDTTSGAMRSDLAIERGVDQRGHYVRMSFNSPHSSSTGNVCVVQGPPGMNHYPVVHRQEIPRQSTPRLSSPRPTSHPHSQNQSKNGGSYDLLNSMQIVNDSFSQTSSGEAHRDVGNMGFFSSETELMSAFESSLTGFDYSPDSFDYFMTHAASQSILSSEFDPMASLGPTPIPPTPDLLSSASTFSGSPVPYDFSGRSASGSSSSGSMSGGSPETPLEPSPMLPAGSLVGGKPPPPATVSAPMQENRLLPCPHPGCKRQFKNTSTLTGHLKTHAGKGIRFPCSFPPCQEKFSRRHDQLRHEVYKHGKRCEWVCTRCNSFFSYERSLEKHVCSMDKSRRGSLPYTPDGAESASPTSAR